MIVRPARAEDEPAVRELLLELGHEAGTGLHRVLVDPAQAAFVAEHGGTVVGFVNVNVRFQLHHERPVATIDELVVTQGRRGEGIGELLVDAALAVAHEHDCDAIELTSGLDRDRAHAFYERLGFETIALKLSQPLQG